MAPEVVQEGDKITIFFLAFSGRAAMSAPMLEVSLSGVGTVLCLEGVRCQWSIEQGRLPKSAPIPTPSTIVPR